MGAPLFCQFQFSQTYLTSLPWSTLSTNDIPFSSLLHFIKFRNFHPTFVTFIYVFTIPSSFYSQLKLIECEIHTRKIKFHPKIFLYLNYKLLRVEYTRIFDKCIIKWDIFRNFYRITFSPPILEIFCWSFRDENFLNLYVLLHLGICVLFYMYIVNKKKAWGLKQSALIT